MLEGIRVVDFSQYIPGSYASYRLAELGAEVIKVEPLNGSPIRSLGKNNSDIIYSLYNYNKKSLTLNLKELRGQELARLLISSADVVIEGYRPGVMAKYNLDYNSIKQQHDNIVYLSLTGYGQKGISADFGSHDLNYISLSGAMTLLVDKESKPILPKITFADIIGGISASERILSALFYRERTGKGQYIDLALLDEIFTLTKTNANYYKSTGEKNLIPQLDGELISYNIYQTRDNRYVSLAALEHKFWLNFCKGVKKEEWVTAHLSIQSDSNPVFNELKELFLSRTLAEWTEFSLTVDCCLTPILEIDELESYPYFSSKGLINMPANTPAIGENTEEILLNILKLNQNEIKNLREAQII